MLAGAPDPPPMPIVVGVARSGTTLLRLMLDAHPELAIPPETGFLSAVSARRGELDAARFVELLAGTHTWADFHLDIAELAAELARAGPCFSAAGGVRCFYRLYALRCGKPRWGDKTPSYVRHISEIQALLPEARFLHIVRDGRDVALSLRRAWFAPTRDIAGLALHWRETIEAARRQAACSTTYLELRYEDLVRAPEPELRRICGFLDLPFADEMLRHHERAPQRLAEVEDQRVPGGPLVTRAQRLAQHPLLGSPPRIDRIGRWRHEMTPAEQVAWEAAAGDLLSVLGYSRPE